MNSARYTADDAVRTEPPKLALNPSDAKAAGVRDGAEVRVATRFGALDAVAEFDVNVRAGAVTLTHGWLQPNVAELTSATEDLDPQTGMVRQSGLAVTVTPV